MDYVPEYCKVCIEHEIPTSELLAVLYEIRDLPGEQQNEIRRQKAKEFVEKYPRKTGGRKTGTDGEGCKRNGDNLFV